MMTNNNSNSNHHKKSEAGGGFVSARSSLNPIPFVAPTASSMGNHLDNSTAILRKDLCLSDSNSDSDFWNEKIR